MRLDLATAELELEKTRHELEKARLELEKTKYEFEKVKRQDQLELERPGCAGQIGAARIVSDFIHRSIERCPVTWPPASHVTIAHRLCAFAAGEPYHSKVTRDALLEQLEQALERADVSAPAPARRTFRTFLLRTPERPALRMVRLKE